MTERPDSKTAEEKSAPPRPRHRTAAALVLSFAVVSLVVAACASRGGSRGEGLDAASLPPGLREDYTLFARRCSKCHGLSRALASGIEDDDFWRRYVTRMRLQPGSGISLDDEKPILRFLYFYSADLRRAKATGQASWEPPALEPPLTMPASAPPPVVSSPRPAAPVSPAALAPSASASARVP